MEKIPFSKIYQPSSDEFENFEFYLEKLNKENAGACGIIKIIPPHGWVPSKNNRRESMLLRSMKVKPYLQKLQEVDGKKGISLYKPKQLNKMSIDEFDEKAKSYVNGMLPSDCTTITENGFWSAVKSDKIRALYAADVGGTLMEENCAGQWNFANFMNTTLLKLTSKTLKIPGISTPYLYFSSPFTFSPWHSEDINLYSINYLHYGDCKTWYGIPSKNSGEFEEFTNEAMKTLLINCSAPMRHKLLMVDPTFLPGNIDVHKVIFSIINRIYEQIYEKSVVIHHQFSKKPKLNWCTLINTSDFYF